jgi:hypothetical protein
MPTFSIYTPFADWKSGEIQASPFIHLSVAPNTIQSEGVLLSAQLVSAKEIDESIDQLRVELEDLRKKAKNELQRLQDKIRKG